jgi:hypothetical protein
MLRVDSSKPCCTPKLLYALQPWLQKMRLLVAMLPVRQWACLDNLSPALNALPTDDALKIAGAVSAFPTFVKQ